MKLKLIVPAGVLVLGALAGCSPAADASAPVAAGQAQDGGGQAQDGGGQAQNAGEKKEKVKEEPLTGELKEQAEAAALKKFPGTVKKSEHDAEKPGNYAVEIELDKGGTVEVYLNKSFEVIGTKDEKGDDD